MVFIKLTEKSMHEFSVYIFGWMGCRIYLRAPDVILNIWKKES